MLVPDPGYCILEVDLSQAEARVVAILARDDEMLQLFNTSDVHKITATWVFESPIDKIDANMRYIGKRVRHAGAYGMKKHRFVEVVMSDAFKFKMDIHLSEWKAGEMLKKFHAHSPKIQGVFHAEVIEAVRDRVLVTPFGRKRTFFERWGDELFKEAFAHIPQSTVSDHLKSAALRIKHRLPDLRIFVEAHDSISSLVLLEDVDRVARIMKEELETPIDFAKCTLSRGKLVIPCEFKIGYHNWKDMEDYKCSTIVDQHQNKEEPKLIVS